jgi:hypothetical protein
LDFSTDAFDCIGHSSDVHSMYLFAYDSFPGRG